jgi:hypothetical protein
MHALYIDESGDLGSMPQAPNPNGNDQPILAIGGIIVDFGKLESLTQDFLTLKGTWFPNLTGNAPHHLDKILSEIKGADIRRNATRGGRNARRHAIGFLEHLLRLLVQNDVKIIARIWVKPLGTSFDGKAVYTSSIQALYTYFDHFLLSRNDLGFCIADSRDYVKNVSVAHSIFTQKFQSSTAVYDRILELPTFGHSQNHAGIQICDILCSSLLYPIAAEVYCTGFVQNVHVQPGAAALRTKFGPVLRSMQHRYQDPLGRWRGGIVVSDRHQKRNAGVMFV